MDCPACKAAFLQENDYFYSCRKCKRLFPPDIFKDFYILVKRNDSRTKERDIS